MVLNTEYQPLGWNYMKGNKMDIITECQKYFSVDWRLRKEIMIERLVEKYEQDLYDMNEGEVENLYNDYIGNSTEVT